MAHRWQIQEVKNRLSEVVDRALDEGPQTITRHGKEIAVLVSKEEFDRRRRTRAPRGTILTFLRGLRFTGARLAIERSDDDDRPLEL